MTEPGLGRTVLELRADTAKFYPELGAAKKEALGFGGVFGPIGKDLKTFGSETTKIGKVLTTSLSLPLTLAGGAAVKFAVDFNKAMANVATLIPGNRARVDELKIAVQEMAIATGQSTDDLAGGLYQVISAFGDTSDTAKILEINAKAAAAGVASTTDAIDLTSAVTKGYGDTSAAAVQQVSDLAFQAVKLGQTTFPELAGSIGRVTPLTAELRVEQAELFGVMATFTGVTGKAAEVSTQLRGVLQALLSPTDAMKGLFQELGVESGRALIEQRGLHGAILAIVETAKSRGKDLKDYIGSIEGQTLALSAAGAQSTTFAEKLGEMRKVAGATEQAFKDQTEGVNQAGFAWEQLKQTAIVAAQRLGDELLPVISEALRDLKPLGDQVLAAVRAFKDLPTPVKDAAVVLGGLLIIAGPVAIGIGKITTAINTMMASKGLAVLTGLAPKLLSIGTVVAGLGAALGAAFTAEVMQAVTAGRDLLDIERDIATVLGQSGGIVDISRGEWLRFAESITVVGKAAEATTPPVVTLTEAQQKLIDQHTGKELLAKARDYAVVLGRIGSASKLTAAEQAEYRDVFAAVIEKYRLLGPAGQTVVAQFERLAQRIPLASTALRTYDATLPPAIQGMQTLTLWAEDLREAIGPVIGLMPAIPSQARAIGAALDEANLDDLTGWVSAVGELSSGFSEFAQIAEGSMATVVRAVGQGVSAFALLGRGFEQVRKGQAAVAEAADTAARVSAGIQIAAGALSMGASMFSIVLTIGHYFDDLQRRENEVLKANTALVASFIEQQGGLAALRRNLQLTGVEWDAWANYLERVKGSAYGTEHAIEALTNALEALKARQAAAASAVALTGELITDWVTPIREARAGLTAAQQAYDDLKADPEADPLALARAAAKVDEFRAKLQGLAPDAREAFDSLEEYAVGAFAAAFTTTGDFYGSLQSMGPLLDDLVEGQEALGLEGSDAIRELLGIRTVQREYAGLLTPLNTATRAVQAMHQAGVDSDQAYQALGRDAKRTYDAMIAGVVDANTAQALMQPTLQALWALWKDGKGAVDDETAALLRQAEEHGIVGENQQTINEQLLGMFGDLKAAIDLMTIAITDWGQAAANAFGRAAGEAEIYGKAVPRGTPALPQVGGGSAAPRTPPGAGGVFHKGGLVGARPVGATFWAAGARYATAHTGMLVGHTALRASDVPILAEAGEGILSRDVGMRTLAALNAGRLPGRDVHQTVQVILGRRVVAEVVAEALPEFLRVVGGL